MSRTRPNITPWLPPAGACLAWVLLLATRSAVVAVGRDQIAWLWPGVWLIGLTGLAGVVLVGLGWLWQRWFLGRRGVEALEAKRRAALAWWPGWALFLIPALETAASYGILPLAFLALGRVAWPLAALASLGLTICQTWALAPRADVEQRPAARWPLLAVVVLSLAGFMLMGWGISRVNQGGAMMAGDEPQYLFVAHSLAVDHDLDLSNQVILRENAQFQPADRTIGGHGRWTHQRVWLSKHMPGLPLLIAPAYGWAMYLHKGVRGFSVLVLWALSVWLAGELYLLARSVTKRRAPALLAALALAGSLPLWQYANLIFPEAAGACLCLLAFRRIRAAGQGIATPWGGLWLAGISAAYLPWLSERYILACLLLAVYFMATNGWRRPRALLAFGLPLLVSGLAMMAYFQMHYGQPWPQLGLHAAGTYLNPQGWWRGMLGLWLDQGEGLVLYAPIWLMGLAGMIWLARKRPAEGIFSLALLLAVYLLAGLYTDWYGGLNPPGRYLALAAPFMALGLAAGLAWGGTAFWVAALAAGLATLFCDLAILGNLAASYGSVAGHESFLQWGMTFPLLSGLLPKLAGGGGAQAGGLGQGLLWAGFSLAVLVFLQLGGRRFAPGKALAGLCMVMMILYLAATGAQALGPGLAQAGIRERLGLWQRLSRLDGTQAAPSDVMTLDLTPARYAHPPAKALDKPKGAVLLPAGQGAGAMVWGQYLSLPPGRYRLEAGFEGQGKEGAAWLDGALQQGKKVLGLAQARGEALSQPLILEFNITRQSGYFEARAGNQGDSPLVLRYMKLRRLP